MAKDNIKGGADGFKKIAVIINKLIVEALGGTHKEKEVPYDDALKAAIEVYKKQ